MLAEVYEPPEETTGCEAAGGAEDDGACAGCCKPLPELEPPLELELAELDDGVDRLVEAEVECP
jgi:hypothetical protein